MVYETPYCRNLENYLKKEFQGHFILNNQERESEVLSMNDIKIQGIFDKISEWNEELKILRNDPRNIDLSGESLWVGSSNEHKMTRIVHLDKRCVKKNPVQKRYEEGDNPCMDCILSKARSCASSAASSSASVSAQVSTSPPVPVPTHVTAPVTAPAQVPILVPTQVPTLVPVPAPALVPVSVPAQVSAQIPVPAQTPTTVLIPKSTSTSNNEEHQS
jgi:hypothetical protein